MKEKMIMSKRKKTSSKRSSSLKTPKKDIQMDTTLLAATLPQEAGHIISMTDEQIQRSQKSMQESLNKTYQLIDNAKNIVTPQKNTNSPDDEVSKVVNNSPNTIEQDSAIEAMQAQMQQSIQQAHQHMQDSINQIASVVNQSIEEGKHAVQQAQQAEPEQQQ